MRLQRRLEAFYGLDEIPAITGFLSETGWNDREAVQLREAVDGALEIAVLTPPLSPDASLDEYCQLIEGVSHFLYLAERARTGLPATQLELELQAEIDKYVTLVLLRDRFQPARARTVHRRLYRDVSYLHPAGTPEGDRYRLANDLAARMIHRLDLRYAARGRFADLRQALTRFYRMGQADKIGLARAA